MAGLTRDTLFLALTRPAMKWGVPWEGFYINTVGTVFGGMILGSPLYWAAWSVIHLVMRAAVARDHNRFRIWRPVNRRSFLQYVRQFLVPTLSKGEVVLMDKLSCHRNVEVRRALRAAGAKLWLLSPDLNPIEQVFAKLKELLRKAAQRTFDHVCERIGKLLDEFSPQECANYLRNAGYAGPSLATGSVSA